MFQQVDEDTQSKVGDSGSSSSSGRRGIITNLGLSIAFLTTGYFYFTGDGSETDQMEENTVSVEEVKNQSIEIPYNDLLRNPEQYEGEFVRFDEAQVTQVIEYEEDFRLRANVTEGEYDWEDDIYIIWEGDRFIEDDIIRVWGEFTGLFTYETTLGEQRTIPQIDGIEVELLEEA